MEKDTYIWGAGRYGVLTALDLENKSVKIKGFIDKNASYINTRLGLPVFEPNKIIFDKNQNFLIIIAVQNENAIKEIMETLSQVGLKKEIDFRVSPLFYIQYQESVNLARATYNGLLFSQSIQDCEWLKYKAFSFGDFGWAMDALALHNLFRILNDAKPKNILEFGLGQSSKMVNQYAKFYKAKAITVEHDKDWINYITTHASQIDFSIYQTDLEDVEINGEKTLSYKNIEQISNNIGEIDFIIVDGPFGQERYSRPQILDFAPQKLAKDFCIFMHDSERFGEQETLGLLCEKLSQSGLNFLRKDYSHSTKQHTVLCSKSWKFLASI